MKYTIYKITNKINKKYYIGVHKTKNPMDSYMGSGTAIKRAIRKYGKDNFSKEILFTFNNEQEAYNKERELITEEVIKDKKCYNMMLGGEGSWSKINELREEKILVTRSIDDENIWMNKSDKRLLSGEYKHYNHFIRLKAPKVKRSNKQIHGKEIHIFNEDNKLMYICKKNFGKVCEEYNLPKKSLINSYKNNGTKIFQTTRQLNSCKKYGHEKFIGWSAKIITNHIM